MTLFPYTTLFRSNYNAVADVTATLTIGAGVYVPEFTFVDKTSEYNGKSQTISLTGEVPEWLTVEFYLNGEEFAGVTEIGEYEITAKFTHGNSAYGPVTDMTAKLIIVKAKISAPKFTGTYSYTGTGIIVKSSDFESFDSAVLKLETSKGTGAGEYKAQFTLLDTEHYEWAEEGAGETVWNIDKAKITATKTAIRFASAEDIVTISSERLIAGTLTEEFSCSVKLLIVLIIRSPFP